MTTRTILGAVTAGWECERERTAKNPPSTSATSAATSARDASERPRRARLGGAASRRRRSRSRAVGGRGGSGESGPDKAYDPDERVASHSSSRWAAARESSAAREPPLRR